MEGLTDFGSAYVIGEKVIEMADRLKPADKIVPGTVATYAFELDGTEFEIKMTVKRQAVFN